MYVCMRVCLLVLGGEKVNHICARLACGKIVRASPKVVETNKFRKAE